MNNLSSVYFVGHPLHVSGIFVTHLQEVYCKHTTIGTCCAFQLTVCWPGWDGVSSQPCHFSNCPTRCDYVQFFLYICKPLYMFRVVTPPIIRSTSPVSVSFRDSTIAENSKDGSIPTLPTDSQLKSSTRTNCCIYTVYFQMMGYKYARKM
jgi:hypothetical protein